MCSLRKCPLRWPTLHLPHPLRPPLRRRKPLRPPLPNRLRLPPKRLRLSPRPLPKPPSRNISSLCERAPLPGRSFAFKGISCILQCRWLPGRREHAPRECRGQNAEQWTLQQNMPWSALSASGGEVQRVELSLSRMADEGTAGRRSFVMQRGADSCLLPMTADNPRLLAQTGMRADQDSVHCCRSDGVHAASFSAFVCGNARRIRQRILRHDMEKGRGKR